MTCFVLIGASYSIVNYAFPPRCLLNLKCFPNKSKVHMAVFISHRGDHLITHAARLAVIVVPTQVVGEHCHRHFCHRRLNVPHQERSCGAKWAPRTHGDRSKVGRAQGPTSGTTNRSRYRRGYNGVLVATTALFRHSRFGAYRGRMVENAKYLSSPSGLVLTCVCCVEVDPPEMEKSP